MDDTTAQDVETVAAGLWFDSSCEGGPTEAEYEAALAALDRLTARIATLTEELVGSSRAIARIDARLTQALSRAEQAEALLAKDPDIDWPAMARLVFDAEARAEQAERERDALRREMEADGPPPLATQVRELVQRNRQLEAALRDLLDDFKWENIVLARAALSTEGEPQSSSRDSGLESLTLNPEGEPAEDRCPTCRSSSVPETIECPNPWHTTPKEDR